MTRYPVPTSPSRPSPYPLPLRFAGGEDVGWQGLG